MNSIATLTVNPTIDVSTTVDHVTPDQKLRCGAPRYEPGGGGINVARAITRLGGRSDALYAAGGTVGEMMGRLLDQESVSHRPLAIDGVTRQSIMIFEETSGRQFRFGMPGPELSESEWRRCIETFEEMSAFPDYVVASGSLPPGPPVDFYARLARVVRERGGRIIVDTSGEPLRAAAEAGVYLLKPNMRELAAIAGRNIEDEADQERVARMLVEEGKSEAVVVSLGAAGALLVTRDSRARLRSPSAPIRSKVGAGDSMVGGMALALARGERLTNAVMHGMAAGAAAVMTPGSELCRREDAERLYDRLASEHQPMGGIDETE